MENPYNVDIERIAGSDRELGGPPEMAERRKKWEKFQEKAQA